jgi:uncharacterized protein YijF (DUF1287 family)
MIENQKRTQEKEISISKNALEANIGNYMAKVTNQGLNHISILSNDGAKEEAVILNIEEYKSLTKTSFEEMLLEIIEELKNIKEDIRIIKDLK